MSDGEMWNGQHTRRQFLKRTGVLSVATVLTWHGLPTKSWAETEGGGAGGSSGGSEGKYDINVGTIAGMSSWDVNGYADTPSSPAMGGSGISLDWKGEAWRNSKDPSHPTEGHKTSHSFLFRTTFWGQRLRYTSVDQTNTESLPIYENSDTSYLQVTCDRENGNLGVSVMPNQLDDLVVSVVGLDGTPFRLYSRVWIDNLVGEGTGQISFEVVYSHTVVYGGGDFDPDAQIWDHKIYQATISSHLH